MVAEVIFSKRKSDPVSPLVSDALTIESNALTSLKAPAFLPTSSQAPS